MDINSERVVVADREDYRIELEYNKEFAILHIMHVKNFTRSTYNDMQKALPMFEKFLSTVGYEHLWAGIPMDNNKTQKLATRLGFKFMMNFDGYSVYRKEI